MPLGFLIVFSEPGAQVSLDEYHDWYNNEHIPIRLNHLSSFLTGARFTASDGSKPSWVALYDVDDTATFQHESYTNLRANRSAREKDVIQRLEILDRRTCELLSDSGESSLTSSFKVSNPTKTIITHGINGKSDDDQDIRDWASKCCQTMEQMDGWVRTRTFKCIDNLRTGTSIGQGPEEQLVPRYIAVHEMTVEAVEPCSQAIKRSNEDAIILETRNWELYRAYPTLSQRVV